MVKRSWKGHYHPLKWIIWSLAVVFLFYEYFIRVTPSLIVPELMQAFHINAGQVGLLSSFYFYAYAMMQVPVGFLSDRFGARYLLSFGCLFCGIGGLLFGMSASLFLASLGRFLIGLGSAFGFIGVIFVSTHWFAQKRWAFLIGMGNSIGMLGAVCGEGPLSYAIIKWDWRPVVIILALIGFIIGLIIYLVVRNDPKGSQKPREHQPVEIAQSIKIVAKSNKTWIIGLASGCYYSCLSAFGALWGIPFFKTVYGFSTSLASFATSMIYLGFIFGGPLIGYFSDHLRHRKPLLLIFTVLTFCMISLIVYVPSIPVVWVFILLFICGLVASGQLLTYTFAIESNPLKVKATAVGFVNAMVFVVGSVMQPVIGYFLELYWDRQVSGGIPQYSPENYMVAFAWFPVLLIIAFILLSCIHESEEHAKTS